MKNIVLPCKFLFPVNSPLYNNLHFDTNCLKEIENSEGYILIEREVSSGKRIGIVAAVTPSEIIITEEVQKQKVFEIKQKLLHEHCECSHTMLLLDDNGNHIETLYENRYKYKMIYNFILPNSKYRIKGWYIPRNDILGMSIIDKINNFKCPYLYVGDGNHTFSALQSLVKEQKREDIFLSEIVNLYSPMVSFNKIYRCVFVDKDDFNFFLNHFKEKIGLNKTGSNVIEVMYLNEYHKYLLDGPPIDLLAKIQDYLRWFSNVVHHKIEYLYDYEEVKALVKRGYLVVSIPNLEKVDYIYNIKQRNLLPEKSFSIGLSGDKRFCLESREVGNYERM